MIYLKIYSEREATLPCFLLWKNWLHVPLRCHL